MAKIAKRRGRYVVDYCDAAKRRRWKSFTHRKDAESFLSQVIGDRRAQASGVQPLKRALFGEYARNWLEARKADLRPATYAFYGRILNLFILPRLDRAELAWIDREAVQRLKAELSASGIAPRTTNHALSTLKTVLGDAVLNNYLALNPASTVKPVPVPKKQKDFLRPQEISRLVGAMKERQDRAIVLTAALTGLREGEVFGLSWDDVDFASRRIFVRRQFGRHGWGEPKTETSKRAVAVPEGLLSLLRELPSRFKGGLVFPGRDGQPILAGNWMRRVFRPALRRAGLRGVTFHSLRDTFVAMAIEAGLHPKQIQEMVGHTSIRTTLDLYGGLMYPASQGRGAAAIEEVFTAGNSAENGSKMVAEPTNEKPEAIATI